MASHRQRPEPGYRRSLQRRAAASKWPGTLKENKHNIVAAIHVRGEPPAVGPDEIPRTPEGLGAKTAKTTIRPKTEDNNPETPINPAAKTGEAERLGLIVTRSAEFG
jgi:hypothetical protein